MKAMRGCCQDWRATDFGRQADAAPACCRADAAVAMQRSTQLLRRGQHDFVGCIRLWNGRVAPPAAALEAARTCAELLSTRVTQAMQPGPSGGEGGRLREDASANGGGNWVAGEGGGVEWEGSEPLCGERTGVHQSLLHLWPHSGLMITQILPQI